MSMSDQLKLLPDLNQLYAKKRMRTQRLDRLEKLAMHNKLTQAFGESVISDEKALIETITKEIENTIQHINNIADEWASKIREFMGDGK